MSSPYDEMVTGAGALRPHWRGLMETVWSLSPEQLAEKQARAALQMADADRLLALREHAAGPPARSLDFLPLILPEAEWRVLAEGLVERARLLDAILADLYGPQRLIEERLLPPYLVLGNPAFLRPLRWARPEGGVPHLHFYAADLVRLPSGEWRVFADRTQAAAGVGYALHHRAVLARTFPEAFRTAEVRRLESFLELWQTSLAAIGSALAEPPQIVLLTPGPYNDAYFEHVLLARELGITIVQSADLTVRNNFVFLKTLDGLVKVDVIYRRVDGDYCDSLELREESALGVAGLVEVMRCANVAVLNLPGSAVIETPAFAPFLPQLSRRLFAEELRLPAVTTWWCGQERALSEVRAGLDGFALQPVFEPDPVPVEPALLASEERARFEAQLARHPERFVARERMAPSLAPCLAAEDAGHGQGRVVAAPILLRALVLWHAGAWVAFPGGVARIASDRSIYHNLLRHGGIAKDVWVLAEEERDIRLPVAPASLAVARARRADAALRSRTADDLYWLGRNVERLDAGARQLLAALYRLASGGLSARDRAELGRLAAALVRTGWISVSLAAAPMDSAMLRDGVSAAAAGGEMMRRTLDAIHRLTLAARDQLSLDMWHVLHQLTGPAAARLATAPYDPDRLLEALDGSIATVAAFAGLVAENMTRGAGWRFLDLGRRIERGIAVAQAVHGVMSGPVAQSEAGVRLALELCDSTNAYLLRYPAEARFARALEFVLTERNNPRALLYQLDRIDGHLSTQAHLGPVPLEGAVLLPLIARVEQFPLEDTHPDGGAAELAALLDLLDDVAGELLALSDAVTRAFFTHVASACLVGFPSRPALAEAET